MSLGSFIWADLSTYNTQKSIQFYKSVFGWQITDLNQYHLAQVNSSNIAGIFETPEYLKKIRMPHFWMSYFQVDSTEDTVEVAKSLKGKIEVDSTQFYNGKIALIRDPQGAGFTIYDGDGLYFDNDKVKGSFIKTELHVSNIKNILPFYSSIFNWNITISDAQVYKVSIEGNENMISIMEVDNLQKGSYEYWVTTILVKNINQTTKLIQDHGGSLIAQEEYRNLMSDNSGEAFFYIEENDNS